MSDTDMYDAMQLCCKFEDAAERIMTGQPDVRENIEPYARDLKNFKHIMDDLWGDALTISGKIETMYDSAFNDAVFGACDLWALALSDALSSEDLSAALPDGLKGNGDIAQLLRDNGALAMADLCMATPA